MLPQTLLTTLVSVRRRVSQGVDTLGNPVYGAPTSGAGWNTVYTNLPVRFAFSSKMTNFAPEGERIQPIGTMYYNPGYDLLVEDRILTPEGIEYTVINLAKGFLIGSVIDHYEAVVALP
jgi:hypothetical protein